MFLGQDQEREEVKRRVQDAVEENQRTQNALPPTISTEDYWKEFSQQALPSTLYVRRLPPKQDHVDKQVRIYLMAMKDVDGTPVVVMTYADGDSVGEFFEVELSRIVAVE